VTIYFLRQLVYLFIRFNFLYAISSLLYAWSFAMQYYINFGLLFKKKYKDFDLSSFCIVAIGKEREYKVSPTYAPCTKMFWLWDTPLKNVIVDGSNTDLYY